jgi:hypothetical protein
LEGVGQLDHISKVNSFARIRALTKLSWAGRWFQGFRELPHNIAGRDGVGFGGIRFWNQVAIS